MAALASKSNSSSSTFSSNSISSRMTLRRAPITESDRRNEIKRVLNALKVNPFDILNLDPFEINDKSIRKKYKTISLLIHPDKVSGQGDSGLHSEATRAFAKLAEAKKMMNDEMKDYGSKKKIKLNKFKLKDFIKGV